MGIPGEVIVGGCGDEGARGDGVREEVWGRLLGVVVRGGGRESLCIYAGSEAVTAPPGKSQRPGKPEREGLLCLKVVVPNHPGLLVQTDCFTDLHSFCLGRIVLGNS